MNELSAWYLAALKTHVEKQSQPSLQVAHDLGVQAVDMGLETLDVAKIHEAALASLAVPSSCVSWDELSRRATIFFTEAITPIEQTHRAAQESVQQLHEMAETLDQRTHELADSNRELNAEILERKTADATLKSGQDKFGRLLKESNLLEEDLQDAAHKILSENEEDRELMRCQLQDEMAQILLGIHISFLTLKNEVAANTENLPQNIATTQRLLEESLKTINCLAREFGIHPN